MKKIHLKKKMLSRIMKSYDNYISLQQSSIWLQNVFFSSIGLRVGNETKGNLCNHLHLKVIIFVMKLIESIKNRTGKFWLPTNSEQIWILNEMFVLTSYIVHGSCNNEFETATELNGLNYQGC